MSKRYTIDSIAVAFGKSAKDSMGEKDVSFGAEKLALALGLEAQVDIECFVTNTVDAYKA